MLNYSSEGQKMMDIAIFENEYEQVEYSFQLVNKLYYDNQLKYSIFEKSQEFKDLNEIKKYALIFIDLDLSLKSELDGYSLIEKFIQIKKSLPIIILTGAAKVEDTLKSKGLPAYEILLKPLNYKKLLKVFEKYITTPKIKN